MRELLKNKKLVYSIGAIVALMIIGLIYNSVSSYLAMKRYNEYIRELEEQIYDYETESAIWERERMQLYDRIDSTGNLYDQSLDRIDSLLNLRPAITDEIRDSIRQQLIDESR